MHLMSHVVIPFTTATLLNVTRKSSFAKNFYKIVVGCFDGNSLGTSHTSPDHFHSEGIFAITTIRVPCVIHEMV